MLRKTLKIAGIVIAFFLLLTLAAGLWIYKNQEEIFRRVQDVVNEEIDGELEVTSYHFAPLYDGVGFTFKLYGITLHDSRFKEHKTDLIKAEQLLVTLDIRELFKRKVVVRNIKLDNGQIFIFKRKDGFSNLSMFGSKKKQAPGGGKTPPNTDFLKNIKRITFANFKVNVIDSISNRNLEAVIPQLTNYISSSDTSVNNDLEGFVLFKKMVFRADHGSFLRNKNTLLNLHLSYNSKSNRLTIKPSDLQTDNKDVIGISGNIDFSTAPGNLNLQFSCQDIRVPAALELLSEHLQTQLDRFGKSARATAKVNIANKFGTKATRVFVDFRADSLAYVLRFGNIKGAKAYGIFTNQANPLLPPGSLNSMVTAHDISGFFETLPVKGKLTVNNFKDPQAVLSCEVRGDKNTLNGMLDPQRYRATGGEVRLVMDYKGPLKDFYNYKQSRLNGSLKGKVSINDLAMLYVPQKVSVSKIKGDVHFDEKIVSMPDVHFSDGQNKVFLSGKMTGFLQHFYQEEMPLVASLAVRIPEWSLNWISKFINNNPQKIRKKRPSKVKLSDLLDDAIDHIQIDATLDAKTLKYKSLVASGVKGKMNLTAGSLVLDNFSMNACGGSVKISGGINFQNQKSTPQLYLRGNLNNADVQSVFASLENFGQNAITHENIEGKLTSSFQFNSLLSNNVMLIPSSMSGRIKIKLNQAQIINFEPFLRIKKLIFKRRNLEHVRFDLFEREFVLRGEEIEINKMQVESNVLTLFVDGVYSFGNKTDINIQIPFSNLKKRDENYEFKVYHPDSVGRSFYLKARDEKGKVVIRPVLLSGKKDKKETEEIPEIEK